MVWAQVWHQVRDYDAWRPHFDRSRGILQRHGCDRAYVYRGQDDPNDVMVALQFPDRASAEAFFADPALAQVMKEAGVLKRPIFSFSEEARVPTPA